ncbi:hypothetical protein CVT24_002327 [Panaeolus cyanescens]|uniref:DNA 3'-5' helicase n=1 Tax=Panaeolus cyanescens TaxID=181874 RepID=A0A409YIJ1_9AGAR|nr:hypothetical protein CVT24_002327 [Panaeolus cyanescens]
MLDLFSPELERLRQTSVEELNRIYLSCISKPLQPVSEFFWDNYNDNEKKYGLLACLILWAVTNRTKLPRKFQLEATIAVLSDLDSLLDVGTNAGKTLCMVLPCLVSPNTMAVVFSPLKRLQAVQVLTFEEYGLKAVAINEDTPDDPKLWKEIEAGKFQVLLIQPEQLSSTNGHLARLARLLNEKRPFAKLIRRIHVDEAHFIYTAGLSHYGLPPFRAAWSGIGDFRVKVGRQVPIQALSGTQPPHIKGAIIDNLLLQRDSLLSIKLTSNRPNIVYATHRIVGELSQFRNLDFLVPVPYPDDWTMPKTLVFHDKVDLAVDAVSYLESRLPSHLQRTGFIAHYHGGMSKEYLTSVYEDFSKENGKCRILHATEGASTGLDIPDIEIVVQYGISRDVPTTLQRGGRGGRGIKNAIFLIMYEPWVDEVDITTLVNDQLDPDHPFPKKLTPKSNKRERLGSAMIKIIQSDTTCLRRLFAGYLEDETPEALTFTTRWCCNRHENPDDPSSGFRLSSFFAGQLLYSDGPTGQFYYGDVNDEDRVAVIPERKEKKARPLVRKPIHRPSLISRLDVWLHKVHSCSPLYGIRPQSYILDNRSIEKLARIHPSNFTSPNDVTSFLNETEAWALQYSADIYDIITGYDQELENLRIQRHERKKTQKKSAENQQNQAMFELASMEIANRAREAALKMFMAGAAGRYSTGLLNITNLS